MRNEIIELKNEMSLDSNKETIEDIVTNLLFGLDNIYSYFVGRKADNIVVKIVCSEHKHFNTINVEDAKDDIITSIINYIVSLSNEKCITFGQPPIELIIELYQPMLGKMVDKIRNHWQMFENDDLMSMANYVTIKLYRQGYYLNRSLIWTSLNNEVLLECRKLKNRPNAIALEDVFKDDSDEDLTYGDLVKDTSDDEELEDKNRKEFEKWMFEQVKDIIIDKIGERQWDRLYRDYTKGHTTIASQQSMRRIKDYFKELGLNRQDFVNYYER